ncbi:MAG: PTS sugar transporter subunit IIA [Rubrivivax sp.]
MSQLLIVAHAPLASALRAVGAHAFPQCGTPVQAVDVSPDEDPDLLESRLRGLIGSGESLVLCDTLGATPCNVAQRAAYGLRARVVTGVSVPMLWRALCYAGEPLDAWAARAAAGGTQGVLQVTGTRPQNQSQRVPADAPLHHHDQ